MVTLDALMESGQTPEYTVDEFEAYFFGYYPFMRDGEKDSYRAVFDKLRAVSVPDEVAAATLKAIARRATASRLARRALEVLDGSKPWEALEGEVQSLSATKAEESGMEPVTNDLAVLLESAYAEQGLRWRLDSLNTRLGSLRKGDFGFVFARPETGKTTFLADQGSWMAEQAKTRGLGPVVWFNNEEVGSKVVIRVYQSTFQLALPSLLANPQAYRARFAEALGSHFLLFDNADSKDAIESAFAKYSPSLAIFDQIDKIKGFAADRNDLELGEIYQWARRLAKEYCPVVGVCQSDGSGEGVKWLTMGNVANAKTSKQAEADWILGIGKQSSEGYDHVRYLHLSKNKLFGDRDSDSNLRHDRWEVLMRPEVARYEDVA